MPTIFLPHSRAPSHCFTSYSTSLNPATPNVGIIYVIRFHELSFSSSPFYELFYVDHFLSHSRRPKTVSPHIHHLLTLLHPMWGLILLSASISSPSFPLPSMSSFLSTIFLPHSGVPSHCFTSYSTSLNPPTPNVGIDFVIRFYELSFSSSPFYELFSKDHFSRSQWGALTLFHLMFNIS